MLTNQVVSGIIHHQGFDIMHLMFGRLADEKAAFSKHCEETVSVKEAENEQLKLNLEEMEQELLLAQNKVCLIKKKRLLFCQFPRFPLVPLQ